jgi:3-deoxy-D-manno-octulosonic-acid transferase
MKKLIPFFYDGLLFLFALFLFPKIFYEYLFRKKYQKRFRAKPPPLPKKRPVIWLHAVSLGEMKALATLAPFIRNAHPDAFILVSSVTETGQEEARKRVQEADAYCYLPLDFSYLMKKFVRRIKPDLLILVEGDFWFNFLREVKKGGGKIVVVNGKLSQKSLRRYLFFSTFSHTLFSMIDHFFLQGESYLERFIQLGIPPDQLTVTGNLKFDIPFKIPSEDEIVAFQKELGITSSNYPILTLGSTHKGEEEALLRSLTPLWKVFPHLTLLLVPRHPERFQKVKVLLQKQHLHPPQVILVDRMGILAKCYQLSDIAIVGGSFVKGIGGHDIFEPAKMGIPVLFGPYMHSQVDLTNLLLTSGAGKQLTLDELTPFLFQALSHKNLLKEMGGKGKALFLKVKGAAFRTWKQVEPRVQSIKKDFLNKRF